MSRKKFPPVRNNEQVHPIMDGYQMKCCDCGLVHELDFRALKVIGPVIDGEWSYKALDPIKYRIMMRARRIDKRKKKS